jgi:NAD(P)H-dependent flavin oxidoreductase YrpB (nitropropane dioxygenase family)
VSRSLSALLRIRYPLLQAPIGSATGAALAAAVSDAGALGMLSITWRERAAIVALLGELRARTSRPFAVNVVLAWPQEERVELALSHGCPVVSTFWGSPAGLVARVHAAGALLVHTVGSVVEATEAAAAGADALVVQGVEAGGHVRGTRPLLELLPAVRARAGDLRCIAAGGLGDAAGVRRVLEAGADGVMLGTRFLCSAEARVDPVYQRAVLAASSEDTVLTELFDKGWPGAPHRVLRNSTFRRWDAAGRPPAGARPGEHDVIARLPDGAPVERYADTIPVAGATGELEALALYAGESAGAVRDVRPAGEIVRALAAELDW